MSTIRLEDSYLLPTYRKFPLALRRGRGAYVWNERGERFLDFYGGHAVVLAGHCHPKVVAAVTRQLNQLVFYSNVVYSRARAEAARSLVRLAQNEMTSVFFCNSGAEANEAALRLARRYTGREGVVSFRGSFHGRTAGAISVTGIEHYRAKSGPFVPEVTFADFGDLGSVKRALTSCTAAVMLEPIQSIAGVHEAGVEFYRGLRRLTAERGIVLIFDEVQTGLGRTGRMFYGEHCGVCPDIITLAKGIASGLPAGAVLASRAIARSVVVGDLGSTFGGGPAVMAAVRATLEVVEKEKLAANAERQGRLLREELSALAGVEKVTGRGLLVGIHLSLPAAPVVARLLELRVLAGTSDKPNVLRVMPPLNIKEPEVRLFVRALGRVLTEQADRRAARGTKSDREAEQ